MVQNRIDLHNILTAIPNVAAVYYQPPINTKLVFPCIIYKRDGSYTDNANNNKYIFKKKYQITVVTRTPDETIADRVETLRYSSFDRHYVSDGLNHYIFTIYF